jgi:hypothetical protein
MLEEIETYAKGYSRQKENPRKSVVLADGSWLRCSIVYVGVECYWCESGSGFLCVHNNLKYINQPRRPVLQYGIIYFLWIQGSP